jgi:large conductance mechanosensitive channel
MRESVEEFKEFMSRGNVVELAIGIVIGAAFATVVTSFVNDVLNACIGAVVGKPNFNDLELAIGDGVVFYGRFLTALVNFAIVAFALFLVVKAINALRREEEPEPTQTERDVLIEIRELLRDQRAGSRPTA